MPGTWKSRCKGPGVGISRAQMRKKKDAVHGETQGSLVWPEVTDEVSRALGKKRNLGFYPAGSREPQRGAAGSQLFFFSILSVIAVRRMGKRRVLCRTGRRRYRVRP